MPGPVSDSFQGTPDDAPYVPSWCYTNGPKMCACGHHEGYHTVDEAGGKCLHAHACGCAGMPFKDMTPLESN